MHDKKGKEAKQDVIAVRAAISCHSSEYDDQGIWRGTFCVSGRTEIKRKKIHIGKETLSLSRSSSPTRSQPAEQNRKVIRVFPDTSHLRQVPRWEMTHPRRREKRQTLKVPETGIDSRPKEDGPSRCTLPKGVARPSSKPRPGTTVFGLLTFGTKNEVLWIAQFGFCFLFLSLG